MKYETPATSEWDIKMTIAEYVRTHNYCTREDILQAHRQYCQHKIEKTLLQLEFIGIITADENNVYRYIAEEDNGDYYGNKYY